MAETKTTRAKTATKKPVPKKETDTATPKISESTDAVKASDKSITAKDIDPHQYVTVRNGFHGKLVYQSKHTGEIFIWDEFGDEQEMELRELRDAKSSNKKMFINNYFAFDEKWIIDYLGVGQFYSHGFSIENFDDIFKKTPEEIKKIISDMPIGQKRSVSYRARTLIAEGEIDSMKVISALEEALGTELIEK